MFKVEISDINIPISDIGGVSEVESNINYNDEIGSYTIKTPTTLEIVGTGFKNLYEAFINDFRNVYTIKIYKKTENNLNYLIFDGEIHLTETIFEPKFAKATVTLVNKGFQNRIEINYTVPVSMSAEQTKNSKDGHRINLTPPSPIPLDSFWFWTAPGSQMEHNGPDPYDLKDCFTQIVSYISDNEVAFESTWYDNIGDENHICVTTGENFRSGGGDAPILNFRDLFLWCKRLFDLVFLFDTDNDGNKTMRIEHVSYLEQSGTGLFIDNTVDLSVKIDQTKLYSSVRVGSEKSYQTNGEINNANLNFPIVQGGSFGIEQFSVQGEGVADNQLDLTVQCLYDHNRLEDMARNNVVDYDKDIVFIQYTLSTTSPTQGDLLNVASLSDADWFYNQMFLNNAILMRQSIYAPLVLHIADGSDTFLAQAGLANESDFINYIYFDNSPVDGSYNTSEFLIQPNFYPNDFDTVTYSDGSTLTSFDANNNFGDGTTQGTGVPYTHSKFIAPNSGIFAFEAKTKFRGEYYGHNFGIVRHNIVIADSGGTIKSTLTAEYAFRRYPADSVDGVYFNANGNGYTDYKLIVGNTGYYGDWIGVSFTIVQNKLIYLDANDRVYVTMECEERSSNSLYPNPEYTDANGTTGKDWNGQSGTKFKLTPQYFACTKTTEALNINITPQNPIGLYEVSFSSWINEENVKDVLVASNTNVQIYNKKIITNGIVKSLTLKHKDNFCNFVVSTRNIKNGS